MRKQQAIDLLIKEFKAEKFRNFFTEEVEKLVGEGDFISKELWMDLRKYFNTLT